MDLQQDVNETFFRYLLSLTFRVRCLEANGKSFSKVRQIVGIRAVFRRCLEFVDFCYPFQITINENYRKRHGYAFVDFLF